MTQALPRDILNRFERRWTARATQTESFQARTDRLKRNTKSVPEGAMPPPASPDEQIPAPSFTDDEAPSQ